MSDFEAGSSTTFPAPLAAGRMVVADFDGDGDADIFYQTGGNGTAFQYAQSNGDGTFTIATLATSPFAGLTVPDNGAGTHYAADFDGDGDIDLLAGVAGATGSYFSNNGDGTFSSLSTTTFPAPLAVGRRVVGDFDGDGDADILYQTGANGTAFEYARSNGDGTFAIIGVGLSPFAGLTLPDHNGSNYRAGDFDGDGDIDLMAGVNSSTGFYYSNNGDGTFSSLSTATFPLPAAGSRQTAGDFDSDGDLDILYQTGANGTPFQYARNNGNNTFTLLGLAASPFASLPLPDHTGTNYYAADFDGDGDTDLLAGTNGTTGNYFYQVGKPPEIVSSTPADNATGILVGANIQVAFDESVTKGSGNIYVVRASDDVVIETISVGSAQVTGSGTTWTIDPSVTLAGSTAYAIRFDAGTFVDTDGAIFQGIADNLTLNFITAAVNTAPVVDLNGAPAGTGNAISYTENAAPQQLAPAGTVIDADSLNFDTGQLTVSFSAGGSADDQLTVIHQGTAAGEIGVSGSAVSYGGAQFGTFTGGTGATPLVFTFDTDATPAAVQALMRQIGFSNVSDTPSTTGRTVQFVVTDGDGGTSSAVSATVAVTAVNDTPVVTAPASGTISGFEASAIAITGLQVADVDAGGAIVTVNIYSDIGSMHVSDSVPGGVTSVSGNDQVAVVVSFSGTMAQINTTLAAVGAVTLNAGTDYHGPVVVTFLMTDGGATGVDPGGPTPTSEYDVVQFTVDVLPVNDAPVLDLDAIEAGNDAALAWTEGDGAVALAPLAVLVDDNTSFDGATLTAEITNNGTTGDQLTILSIGDGPGEIRIDGSDIYYEGTLVGSFTGGETGNPLVATFNAAACHCAVQTVMDSVAFEVVGDTPSTDQRTITVTLDDGGGTANGGADTGSAQVLVDVTAADNAPTVLIGAAGPATEQIPLDLKNLISVDDVDTTGDVTVTLTVVSGTLNVEAGTSGVDVNELFPDEVILTGTIAELQALLGSDPTSVVTYTADTDYPPPDDELTVTIDDGATSVSDSTTIAITAVNDVPDLDLDFFGPGNDAALIWTEGDGPQLLAPFALFDDDNDDHDGATLTVTINGATAGDQLAIDSVGTGFGELSISGADVLYEGQVVGTWSGGANGAPLLITFNADACYCSVELAMASILYENTDDLTGADLRTVDFTFVDGDGTANGGGDTTTASVDLTVFPFAEVIAGPDATGNEDATIALTGVAIDGVANDPAVDVITVELGVANGTLTVRTDVAGGLAAADVVGNGSTSLVLTGTQAAINATLAAASGLTYQGDPDFFGTDTLSIDAQGVPVVGSFDFSNILELDVGLPIELLEMYDFDGDGTSDLLIGIEDGLGVFGSVMFDIGLPDPGVPTGFAIDDFDGDGLVDIAVSVDAAPNGYLAFLSSDAGAMVKIADIAFAYDVVTGDFNGDSLADLAVADGDNSRVAIVLQTAPGVFAPVSYTAATTSLVGMLAVGDFNGDNVLDMLVSNAFELPGPVSPGSIDLLLGNGDGTFQAAVEVLSTPASPGEIVVADFDGDGALDFAFASTNDGGAGTNGAVVVLGDGDGTFAAPVGYDTTPDGEPYELVAADFNGDGVLDLAVANFNDPASFSVLVGVGDGSFEPPLEFATIDPPFVIAAGDPDDDGDTDIVVGSLDGWIDGYNNDVLPGRSADATKDIAVTAVNDAPTAANLAGDSVTLNFGDAAVLLDGGPAATIADIDSTDFAGGSLTLAITGGDPSQDLLVIANEGVGVGQIGVAGASVTYGGVAIATAAGGSGGAALVVSFNANATAQAVEALTHAMTYANSGGADPTPGTRTVNWTLVDGDGTANGGADTLALTTSVVVLNADPAIDLNGTDPGASNATSYTEGDPLTAIAPNATVSDPGSIDFGGGRLTVALTANGDVDDALALTGLGYGVGQFSIEDIDLYYNFGNPVGPELIGSIIGGAGGTALVIAFNSLATPAVVEALVRAVGFTNFWTSPGSLQRSVTFTLSNGAGEVSIPVVATIDVTDISDPAVANDDVFGLVENEVRVGNLFADNGNGNDFDPDGDPIQVIEINGTAALVGTTITLASGALLTVNASGSFTYNPNGAFSSLVPAESGAANTAVNDSFTYTITGGATATVSVTQNGVVSVGDVYRGDAGGNAITGSGYADYFDASQGGDDILAGMAGNDAFYFGAAFTGADSVDGGAGDNDQIGLQGNYTGANALVLGPGTITGVEVLAMLPGFDYDVTTVDGIVPTGGTLMVYGGNLGASDNLTFNGSAETNGAFKVYGGAGVDLVTTGDGEDGIYFGPGKFDPLFDRVDGGTGVNDQFVLDGDYTITLDGTAIRNIDMIALLKGVAGDLAEYDLTLDASLVGLGEKITIWGTMLETALAVDGSAVAGDLKFWGGTLGDTLTGGTGNDWIWGGAGADLLAGGDGADTFNYDFAAQSRAFGFDRISGFEVGDDTINLPFAVAGFATARSGGLDAVTMDSMLEIAFTGLTAHQAAVFTATGGDLSGRTFLLVDANGTTGYQASGDFLIELVTPVGTIDQLGMFA